MRLEEDNKAIEDNLDGICKAIAQSVGIGKGSVAFDFKKDDTIIVKNASVDGGEFKKFAFAFQVFMQKVNGKNIDEAPLERRVNGENFVISDKDAELLYPDSDEALKLLDEAIKYTSENIDKIKEIYGKVKTDGFSSNVADHKKRQPKSGYEADGEYGSSGDEFPSAAPTKPRAKQTHLSAQERQ